MNLAEMIENLEQYYEAAGFSDVYEKILKDMSEDEIRGLHEETYGEMEIE